MHFVPVQRHVLAKSLRVAIVVGSALVVINHFDVFFGAYITPSRVLQIFLCYVVPFSVSLYSQVTMVPRKPDGSAVTSKESAVGK